MLHCALGLLALKHAYLHKAHYIQTAKIDYEHTVRVFTILAHACLKLHLDGPITSAYVSIVTDGLSVSDTDQTHGQFIAAADGLHHHCTSSTTCGTMNWVWD